MVGEVEKLLQIHNLLCNKFYEYVKSRDGGAVQEIPPKDHSLFKAEVIWVAMSWSQTCSPSSPPLTLQCQSLARMEIQVNGSFALVPDLDIYEIFPPLAAKVFFSTPKVVAWLPWDLNPRTHKRSWKEVRLWVLNWNLLCVLSFPHTL